LGAALSGFGIAMVSSMLQSLAVRGLPPSQYSIANATARSAMQIGVAIGTAVFVAVLGEDAPGLSEFRTGWMLIVVLSLFSALLITLTGAPAPAERVEPRIVA